MKGTRLRRIRLNYGNQRDRAYEIPAGEGPVVIQGPNGSGKTTLLEAVVRTLFGFNRRADEDKALLAARLNNIESGWCELRVEAPDGTLLDIRRSFEDVKALVTAVESGEERFKGDANPGGTNEQSRQFQALVRQVVGLAEYEEFGRTAFAEQGRLVETRLDRALLQVASGGTGGVDEAKAQVHTAFRELTVDPIDVDDNRARKPRRLEELANRRQLLQEELQETAAKERRRKPLAEEIRGMDERFAGLKAEIEQLEAAQEVVHAKGQRTAEAELAKTRQRQAEEARTGLESARREAAEAEERYEKLGAEVAPEDVPQAVKSLREAMSERTRAAEQRDESRPRTDPAAEAEGRAGAAELALFGGVLVAVVGALVALLTDLVALWLAAPVGLALAAWGYRERKRARDRTERAEAEAREAAEALERAVEEAAREVRRRARVLGMESDDPSTLDAAVDRVRGAGDALTAARKEWDRAETAAKKTLEGFGDDAPGDADPEADLTDRLRACEEHFRREQVKVDLQTQEGEVELPEGVEATPEAVKRALAERRDTLTALQRRKEQLQERLLQEATPTRSSVALKDEIAEIAEETRRIEARIEALRLAHELLGAANTAFREGDEGRLLGRISERAQALSDGEIGPVTTEGALEEARVRVLGRTVRLDSPGLSYGERVAIALALRLGATDFLAHNGIRPPLLIDEPFDDLDPERARGVWGLLQEIARERQVIVTSQNPLTLQHLGIEPDIRLTGRGLEG